MAIKKKTSKKKNSTKTAAKKPAQRGTVKKALKRSQEKIDQMLIKINPNLQEKINNLVSVLANSREGKLGDLNFLAGKILLRAQEISKGLKKIPRVKRK